MPDDRVYSVLFLCTHNSARSVIAEAVVTHLGQGKFKGYSAGSAPSGRVHPLALEVLRDANYAVEDLRSKSWDEFAADEGVALDFIFTVCDNAANETCPLWPGQPATAHWGLPDPSAVEGSDADKRAAFAETHRVLVQRITAFVNLPISSLDQRSLQKRLAEIGNVPIEPA